MKNLATLSCHRFNGNSSSRARTRPETMPSALQEHVFAEQHGVPRRFVQVVDRSRREDSYLYDKIRDLAFCNDLPVSGE